MSMYAEWKHANKSYINLINENTPRNYNIIFNYANIFEEKFANLNFILYLCGKVYSENSEDSEKSEDSMVCGKKGEKIGQIGDFFSKVRKKVQKH